MDIMLEAQLINLKGNEEKSPTTKKKKNILQIAFQPSFQQVSHTIKNNSPKVKEELINQLIN